jgi:hypothetical protein
MKSSVRGDPQVRVEPVHPKLGVAIGSLSHGTMCTSGRTSRTQVD